MPPRVDFKSQRLFIDADMSPDTRIDLSAEHAHYLFTVLRMDTGSGLLVFNGRDGEWRASLEKTSKRAGCLIVGEQTRPQPKPNDLWLVFAPIKRGRIEITVEKSVEMGASHLAPVITDYTQNTKLRIDKLRATLVEAAEQCGVLNVPTIAEPMTLTAALNGLKATDRTLIFCDEQAELTDPSEQVADLGRKPKALLIGPQGGFSESERKMLATHPNARTIALGPRILRAETAAIAGLTLVQLLCGDWRD